MAILCPVYFLTSFNIVTCRNYSNFVAMKDCISLMSTIALAEALYLSCDDLVQEKIF